ncbi:MAG: GLPGLI family protein [Flavobacteriaceae bacterium]
MKYFWIFPLLNFWSLVSQESFVSEAKVDYDLIQTDLSRSSFVKATLLFNNAKAVFIYRINSGAKSIEVSEVPGESSNDHNVVVNTVFIDTLENRIYTDKLNNTFIKTVFDFNSERQLYIMDTIDSLKWELTSDSKKIQSFHCLKAKLNHGGQNLIAWFAPEIPTSFGPLHFGNLAGLILEMYSEDRQFYLASTKVTYPFKQIIVLPDPHIGYITQSEYEARTAKFLDSMNNELRDRVTRILTKSQRGVNISNIKVETKTTKNKDH